MSNGIDDCNDVDNRMRCDNKLIECTLIAQRDTVKSGLCGGDGLHDATAFAQRH